MSEYKELSGGDDIEDIGGFDKRAILNLEVGGGSIRVVMRGMALVDAETAEGDTFESLRFVVQMPTDFKDHELYESELAMSLTGKALIPAAIKHFADHDKFADTGEVWLDEKWVNGECDIQITTIDRENDSDMGYSPLKVLRASPAPMKTKRTDLPSECAPAAAYQQPSTEIGGSSDGEYQM